MAILAGCEKSKEECKSDYGLIDNTKEACIAAFPTLTEAVSPTPGPKIIVRRVSTNLEWKVDSGSGEVTQTTGASAWTSGKIRSDFVGNSILEFSVHSTSPAQTYSNVSYVIFQTQSGADTYTIEMIRTAGDKVRWYVSKGSSRKLLVADSTLSTSEVPLEFTAPLIVSPSSTFREEMENVEIDEVSSFKVSI